MKERIGYLEVITGPMYCGKTEELIRLVKRAAIGKKKIQVFKHSLDTRYGKENKLYSHAGVTFESNLVSSAKDIANQVKSDSDCIAIDEAQWFGEDLIAVVLKLLSQKHHIIISGLCLTFDGKLFPPVPTLMAYADKVTKLSAICTLCGNDAVFHKRISGGKTINSHIADPSFVGKINAYQARCRKCFRKK